MFRIGDVSLRTRATRAALLLCGLAVACEPDRTAPDATPIPTPVPLLKVARARVIEPGDTRIPNPPAVAAWAGAGVTDPLVTVDPATGRVFALESGTRIVGLAGPEAGGVDLARLGVARARGLAFDPTTGHLHVLDSERRRIHELSPAGEVVAMWDVSAYGLEAPRAMTFAPTGDATDDPSAQGLYVATDAGITELSLIELAAAPAPSATGALVRTTLTSRYSKPSPDPSGIAYATHQDNLIISDGEVEEMSIYAGANVFETTRSGTLARSWTTTSFSNEPTGTAYNPANRHLFVSDDDRTNIYEVNPGPDGLYGTADDQVTSFDTAVFGCSDPEGVAFDSAEGALFIADGVNAQVYRVAPGNNGIFDGVSPAGDDQVRSFDTQAHGLIDPEGIAYDSDFGHLYVVGQPETLVFHFSTTGTLLRTVSIAAAQADKPAGMDYAPSSASLSARSLYIVDRGVDNNDDPNENDGKLYELSIPPISGNTLPTVTITAPASGSTFTEGSSITFTGTASDTEDGNLTAGVTWTSSINGALGTGGSVSTSALSLGTHTITASVTDSDGAQASSAMTVTVSAPQSGNVVQVRVAAGTDDAEESATGGVDLTSSDLEMVFDVSNQTVGVRFNGVTVPRGATITRAYVQFQVDETTSIATSLTIQGQAADNAPTFAGTSGNITSRARTTSSVTWSPPAWPVAGAAGADQQTPSLTSIVQEIVSRPGWNSGNSLVLIISGTGERVAEAYEGLPSAAPLLRVEFATEPPGPNVAPTASNVTISGTPQVGRVLTGSYTYSDADGDAEGTSTYRWMRDGATIGGATGLTYTLGSADQDALIVFEVTPVAVTGTSPGAPVQSAAVGPVTAPPPNVAPVASNVAISGTPKVAQVLTGTYTYSDADGDAEGTSTYRWFRNGTVIAGATARTYTLVAADQGAMIVFEVTPVAVSGTSPGTAVQSASVGPVEALPVVTVSSLSPNTVAAGTSVTMTITGSGFAPGARVIFENGTGGPTPTMTNVNVVNETTITGTFTSKREGPKRNRVWDVRVTNTDTSTGALSRGVTITP